MGKPIPFIMLCFIPLCISAQPKVPPDTVTAPPPPWKHSVVSGLTLTQVSFTDWAQGGENALSYTLSVDGKSVYDNDKTNWSNAYKLAFGQTRLGDQGLRKTDDKIDLENVLTYKLGDYVNPYAAATMKTQFARGLQVRCLGGEDASLELL